MLLAVPLAVVVCLLVLPLLTLFRYSIYPDRAAAGAAPTTANYARFFGDSYFQSSIGITLGTAVAVTAICLLLAFPVAYVYARTSFGPKWALLMAILSPFYIEILVKIFAWLVLLNRTGVVNRLLTGAGLLRQPFDFTQSYAGVLIVLVYTTLPFMILSLIGPLQGIDDTVVEAARVCGASERRVFRKVMLPLSIPGIVAGSILTFSLGISSFLVPLLVGGRVGQRFLGVIIYQAMNQNQNWAMGAVEAVILLTAALLIVAIYNRAVRSSRVGVVISDVMAG